MNSRRSLIEYLRGALEIIRCNCQAYSQGCFPCYRVLAVQLRILLCDRKREHDGWKRTAILPEVFPGITLPVIADSRRMQMTLTERQAGLSTIVEADRVPVSKWLEQIVWFNDQKQIEIKDLIKWVTEKDGGAHADPSGTGWILDDQKLIGDTLYQISRLIHTEVSRLLEEVDERPDG